jgi:hypothetical protein
MEQELKGMMMSDDSTDAYDFMRVKRGAKGKQS